MIRLDIVERKGAKLYKRLIDAMRSGDLRTFTVAAPALMRPLTCPVAGTVKSTVDDYHISTSLVAAAAISLDFRIFRDLSLYLIAEQDSGTSIRNTIVSAGISSRQPRDRGTTR